MLIGIEAERANTAQKTGVEHYAKQLILHLAEVDNINQYVLYLRTVPEAWFLNLPKNFRVKVMPFPIFWTQIRISLEILLHPVDVLMIPASALPIIHPKKSIVTIHDIGWRYFPESFTWFMRKFLEWSTHFAISKAKRIIAVSETTKRDIIKFYNADESKIVVIHHGYQEESKILFGEPVEPQNLAKFFDPSTGSGIKKPLVNLPSKYILFLSTLQPRKNLEGLIEAFRLLKNEHPEIEHKLVVVGKPGWKYDDIILKIQKNNDIVIYLNHVRDSERFVILSKADLLVLPSFYEGFGMQILEGFAAGVPVVASKISSMPEIAGEAAAYFDPHSVNDIKKAVSSVLFDRSLAERLVTKGKERLKHFSWQKCALETLNLIKNS